MEVNRKLEESRGGSRKPPENKKIDIPVVPALLAVILILLIIVIILMVRSGGLIPDATATPLPTETVFVPSVTPLPTKTPTERPIGFVPEDAVNAYYSAIRDGKLNIILDEWTTSSLSNQLSDDEDFEETYQQFAGNIEWKILEMQDVDYSEFQTALVQYSNQDVTRCDLFDLADPESTGDHWRISEVGEASCEEGTKVVIPTVTATSVTYFVPDISWYPCGGTYPSRLLVGMAAIVSEDPPIPNNLREDAGQEYIRIGELAPGEEVRITDGPKCVDGWVWWYVTSLKNGEKGWTSEGASEYSYWLVPSRAPGS